MALDQHLKIQVSALILQINRQQRKRSDWPLKNKTRQKLSVNTNMGKLKRILKRNGLAVRDLVRG